MSSFTDRGLHYITHHRRLKSSKFPSPGTLGANWYKESKIRVSHAVSCYDRWWMTWFLPHKDDCKSFGGCWHISTASWECVCLLGSREHSWEHSHDLGEEDLLFSELPWVFVGACSDILCSSACWALLSSVAAWAWGLMAGVCSECHFPVLLYLQWKTGWGFVSLKHGQMPNLFIPITSQFSLFHGSIIGTQLCSKNGEERNKRATGKGPPRLCMAFPVIWDRNTFELQVTPARFILGSWPSGVPEKSNVCLQESTAKQISRDLSPSGDINQVQAGL